MEIIKSPEVVAALITGMAIFAAALIAAMSAYVISDRFKNRDTLEQKYLTALDDIDFLLAVEKAHCEARKGDLGVCPKNRVRAEILRQGDQRWSGRFSRSRIRSEKECIAYNRYVRTNAEK